MGIDYGPERKWRLPRAWSNAEIRRFAPLLAGDVVNISAWRDEDKEGGRYRSYFSGAANYSITNWRGERGSQSSPDEILLNLEAPLPAELAARFDVVFNHTTLEHVFDIFLAFENLARMSRDLLIIVVPCCQEIHYTADFGDFWRFTPQTLRRLCERTGLVPVYESVSPDVENASIYLFLVAARDPQKWRSKLPFQKLPDVYPGGKLVANDPVALASAWLLSRLRKRGWYRRWSKRFIKRHFRADNSPDA